MAVTPISTAQRRQVLALHADGQGRNEIARTVGIALGSVTKIVSEAGLNFDRTATVAATAAAKADARARRAELGRLLLEDAHRLREQVWTPTTVFNFGGKDNTYEEHLMPKPPTGDLRNLMVIAATAIDKHLVLERHDASEPDAAGSLLGALLTGLQQKHGTGDA